LNALAAAWLRKREARQAHKKAEQALELHQRINDQQGQANDLTLLSAAKKDLGDWEKARDLYEIPILLN